MNCPKMRLARPCDVPAIEKLHREQNWRDGTDYPLAKLFDDGGHWMPNVEMAFVIELDGEILQSWVFERKVELLGYGSDPRATAVGIREMEAVAYLLRNRGYEVSDCVVPKQFAKEIEKPLRRAGYVRTDDRFAHFMKELAQ